MSVCDVQNRMVDFGVDAFWMSHEPWIVPQPFTPEAGEMWSKEDIDYWIAVLEAGLRGGLLEPGDRQVRAAQPGDSQARPDRSDEPGRWAMTWRAYRRKRGARSA